MNEFEQKWHDLYMSNMATKETLNKLAIADKLKQADVDKWIAERLEKQGY